MNFSVSCTYLFLHCIDHNLHTMFLEHCSSIIYDTVPYSSTIGTIRIFQQQQQKKVNDVILENTSHSFD